MPQALLSRLLLLALTLLASACTNRIGEACRVNADCSPLGDRFCDLASPGGYCTIEGCDNTSCPRGSVCIRFFQIIPTKFCEPQSASSDCLPSERCLCDCGAPDEAGRCPAESQVGTGSNGQPVLQCGTGGTPIALAGHCAPETSERRWCQLRCDNDGDCRRELDESGNTLYECRQTGTSGSEPIPDRVSDAGIAQGEPAQFCAQKAR